MFSMARSACPWWWGTRTDPSMTWCSGHDDSAVHSSTLWLSRIDNKITGCSSAEIDSWNKITVLVITTTYICWSSSSALTHVHCTNTNHCVQCCFVLWWAWMLLWALVSQAVFSTKIDDMSEVRFHGRYIHFYYKNTYIHDIL